MKENNGKGAARRRLRKLTWWGLLSCLAMTGFLLWWNWDKLWIPIWLPSSRVNFKTSIQLTEAGFDENDPDWQKLLQGRLTLIDYTTIQGVVYGSFCEIEASTWASYQQEPHKLGMFHSVVSASRSCRQRGIQVPVRAVLPLVQQYDARALAPVRILEFKGAVFHESRCGSTLVANMVASLPESRVYAESQPPLKALYSCGAALSDCQHNAETHQFVRDTVYWMSRINAQDHPDVKYLYWKMQSIGSFHLETFVRAVPTTPWIFVFRDSTQVLMSHWADQGEHHERTPNCAQAQHLRIHATAIQQQLDQHFPHLSRFSALDNMTNWDYCAIHLAGLTQTAINILQRQEQFNSEIVGRAVEYTQLPEIVWEDVLPKHFGVPLTETQLELVKVETQSYSKGKTGNKVRRSKVGVFHSDSDSKTAAAPPVVQAAVRHILQAPYDELQTLSHLVY